MKKWFLAVLTAFGLQATVYAVLPDFASLVEKEGKAVVNISTTSVVRDEAGSGMDDDMAELFRRFGFPTQPRSQPRERRAQSLGSGFVIDGGGYVLTNAHVVADATEITVKFADKRTFKAEVIGSDARTDVALLKIDAANLPKVNIGDVDKLKVGEWVVAIGAPFGLENTVTAGIVSAKGRNLPDENFVPFIQTDAAVNPGNSGGPLFNLNGEVVGINSQIYSRSGGYMGLSFAIPIDVAMKVAQELKTNGRVQRAKLGVTIQDVSEDLAMSFGLSKPAGALINSVEKDGPADKAGIKAGDIILKFNGREVVNSGELPKQVSAEKPESKASVHVWRDQKTVQLTATLGELDPADKTSARREFKGKPQTDEKWPVWLSLQELSPRNLKELGIKYGLQVLEATGVAANAGLQRGDVIVGIGGQELTNSAQLKQKLAALKPGEKVALRVMRNGQTQFLVLKAPEK